MKLIFLDIDGVLNSIRSAYAFNGYPYPERFHEKFDMVAVELIRKICEKDVQIVLSSTWRMFENYKTLLGLPIIDKTPYGKNRGGDIRDWMDNHYIPDYWAIIDDDSDMLDEQIAHFIHVDGNNGFSLENYRDTCRLLDIEQ